MICISIGNSDSFERINELKPEMVEIRYDLLDMKPQQVSTMLNRDIRQVATCRPGKYSEAERLDVLKNAIQLGAAFVDVEIESDHDFIASIVESAGKAGCAVIISYHNYSSTPERSKLESTINQCFKLGGNVAKIACAVINETDAATLLSLYGLPGRKVILGMGEKGRITRVAALKLGAEFTFASFGEDDSTAPGQLTYEEFKQLQKII